MPVDGRLRRSPDRKRRTQFPRRKPKREGSLRRGAAFVALRDDGFLLVRTRPAKGLLGGMTEVPTSDWTADFDEAQALGRRAALFFFRAGRPLRMASRRDPRRGTSSRIFR